jgi:hypothetical protein
MGKSEKNASEKSKGPNQVIHRIDWTKVSEPNSPSANSHSRNRPGRSKKGY